MSNETEKLQEIATNLNCPSCLRTAMADYSQEPNHENWLKLNKIYCFSCPCGSQCGKCNILRGIVKHILTTQ